MTLFFILVGAVVAGAIALFSPHPDVASTLIGIAGGITMGVGIAADQQRRRADYERDLRLRGAAKPSSE